MPKIKKRTPIKPPAELERNIQQIYDDINDIINAVNSFALFGEEFLGKPGDLRVVARQQADGSKKFFFQYNTNEGWIEIEGTKVEEVPGPPRLNV